MIYLYLQNPQIIFIQKIKVFLTIYFVTGRHLGFRQMYERLNKFHWKSMAVDCEAYVRTCVTCNQAKSVNNDSLFEYFYDVTDVSKNYINSFRVL